MPVRIVGLDWKGGPYTHSFDIVDVPHRPGVFKLHFREPDGSWRVVLVGEADNLYEALIAHLVSIAPDPRVQELVRTGNCAYSYAELADPEERRAAVRSLVEYFQPELNDPAALPGASVRVEVNPN